MRLWYADASVSASNALADAAWPPAFAAVMSADSSRLPVQSLGFLSDPFPTDPSTKWASLIGIVTAISGNILISLALNIQRYAHLRIERRWARPPAQPQ